jgi:hypothetical protein
MRDYAPWGPRDGRPGADGASTYVAIEAGKTSAEQAA